MPDVLVDTIGLLDVHPPHVHGRVDQHARVRLPPGRPDGLHGLPLRPWLPRGLRGHRVRDGNQDA